MCLCTSSNQGQSSYHLCTIVSLQTATHTQRSHLVSLFNVVALKQWNSLPVSLSAVWRKHLHGVRSVFNSFKMLIPCDWKEEELSINIPSQILISLDETFMKDLSLLYMYKINVYMYLSVCLYLFFIRNLIWKRSSWEKFLLNNGFNGLFSFDHTVYSVGTESF